jgi:hypothetical protein
MRFLTMTLKWRLYALLGMFAWRLVRRRLGRRVGSTTALVRR